MSASHSLVFSGVGLSGLPVAFVGDKKVGSSTNKRNSFSLMEAETEEEAAAPVAVVGVDEEEQERSSSIGVASSSLSEEEDEEEEVQSKEKGDGFESLDCLEECLPIKRGLSNFFAGKSKSFASLSDLSDLSSRNNLEKRENPFNKRRRILLAYKIRRASFGSLLLAADSAKSSSSSSLLSPDRMVEEEEDEEEEPKSERANLFLPL